MEKDTVVAENRQCRGSNLVTKSVDSSIKIDSISIDLINANEKSSAESCDHFSIRKYVSDIRKKDWKMCWPFASDGDGNKCDEHECELPPLHVPKFRYWRCQNCLWEIGAGNVETDQGPALKTCRSGFKSNIICSHASTLQDDAVLVSDLQHLPEINIHEGKKIDANASANMNNTSGYHPSSCNDERKKNTEVTDFLTLAHNLVSDDNSNKEVHQLTSGHASLIQKTYRVDDKVDLNSECYGSIDMCKTAFGHDEVANTELVGNLNCVLKNAAINMEGKVIPAGNQQKELVSCDTSGEHCNNAKEAHKTSKGNGLCSPAMDECDNASSDSAEVMPGKNLCRGSSSGLHRRKTRKVRLLTELLSENGDGDTESIKVDDSQSKGIPDASVAGGKRLDPQGQVIIQGNGRRVLGQHRKRKLDEDEEWRPLEMDSPGKACKEVRVLKRDVESAETIAKAFARMHLQSSTKNHCTKHQNDGSPVLGKKKYKKAIIFDDLVPVQDVLMGAGVKTGCASTSNDVNDVDEVLANPIPKADEGRETQLFPLSSQRTDRKPPFEKKSKILPVDDRQASLIPWNHVLGEDLTTRKDTGFLHAQPFRIPLHSARDASSGKGQNLSLNSFLTMPRYDMQHNPLVEGIDTSLLSWQRSTASEDQVSKKTAESNCVRNLTFASKSASDMSFGKGICSEMSTKGITNSMPLLGENQNYTSQVEIGNCSHMQQRVRNFCSANSNKKAIGFQERPTVIRKDNDHRANKAPEQGNADDIPMEIVELMAKHQYERCLPDAEHDRCQTMNFNKAYGNREVSLFQQGTTQKRNPRAIINRNGITNRGENLGPMKQKVDYFCQADVNQFTMSQLHQTPVPAGYQALFQHQENSSSRIQHSSSASGLQNSTQSCKWIGDLMGKRSSENCLQTSGTCNSCMAIQQNRTNHIWSSMMPNHVPFFYNVPQKCNSLSTNVDALSNSPISIHKENVNGDGDLKLPNQNAANIGKQNRNFASEILRTYPEHPFSCKRNGIELNKKPMGSLDLYANETIPAMHLLSLMDAGLRSSAPINLDVNSKFLKRTSTGNDQDPKEFSRPDSGAHKISNAMKQTSYDPCGKNHRTEDSHRSISAIPAVVGPSSSLFQHDKCFKKAIDFTSQVSHEKVKGKGSDLRAQNKGFRSQKSKSPGGNSGSTYCGSVPVHSMHTMFFGGSDSVMFPLQYSGMGTSTKNKLETPNGTRPGRPPKSSSDTIICSVNRNPADFSAPEARNSYMIAGKDLKFRRVGPLANGYGSTRLNAQKRQKKLPSVKEHRRHPIS